MHYALGAMQTSILSVLKSKLFHETSKEKSQEIIFITLSTLVVTSFLFSILYLALEQRYIAISNTIIGSVFLVSTFLYWKKKCSQKKLINTCLICSYLHLLNVSLATGGTLSPALIWFILLPISAAFLADTISFWISIILTTLTFPAMGLIEQSEIFKLLHTPLPSHVFYIIQTSGYLCVILIASLWIFVYGRAVSKNVEEVVESKENMAELVRLLTHDIAGPLSVIRGYTLFIDDAENDSTMTKKAKDAIERNTDAIESLINKVRELRALDSGKRKLQLKPSDLRETLKRAFEIVQDRYEEKRVQLTLDSEGKNFSAFVEPDVVTLQILPNLLHNALKFSYPGSKVSVLLREEEKFIVIEIQDRGMGIPPTLMKNIFSYDKSTTREGTQGEKGTGFGMPLVKSFVEKMKGTITLQSMAIEDSLKEHGTKVIIRFCRADSESFHSQT